MNANERRAHYRFTGWAHDARFALKTLWVNGVPVRAVQYEPTDEGDEE